MSKIETFEENGKWGIMVDGRVTVPAMYDDMNRLAGSDVFECFIDDGEYAGVYFVNAYGDSMNGVAPHYRELVECYERWRGLPSELAVAQREAVVLRNERDGLLGTKDLLEAEIANLTNSNNTRHAELATAEAARKDAEKAFDIMHARVRELEAERGAPSDAKYMAHELEMAKQSIASRDAEISDMVEKIKQFSDSLHAVIAIAKRSKEVE